MNSSKVVNRRSQLPYTAFLFGALGAGMVFFACACSTLFEPVPRPPGSTNNSPALVQPASSLTSLVQTTGNAFGPLGSLGAGAFVIALQAAAYFLNRKHTADTVADASRTTDQFVSRTLSDHLDTWHAPTATPPTQTGAT